MRFQVATGVHLAREPVELFPDEVLAGETFIIVDVIPGLVTKRPQSLDRVPNRVAEVKQGVGEVKGLPLGWRYLEIRHLYLKGELDIHMHWAIRPKLEANLQHVCSVIKGPFGQLPPMQWSIDFQEGSGHASCEKLLMLVDYVEPVEQPQGVELHSAFVGLQPIECCLETSASDFGTPASPKPWSRQVDRELSGLLWRSMPLYNSPGQMIERTAEIVDTVTNKGRPVRWRLLGYLHVVQALTSMSVDLTDNAIGFTTEKTPDLGIESIKVLFCPHKFGRATLKGITHVDGGVQSLYEHRRS